MDMFGFSSQALTPARADKCTVQFGGATAGAVQVTFTATQTINKRRSMGNAGCIVWSSQPGGQATIQRMVVNGLSSGPFDACSPQSISFSMGGCGGSGNIRGSGCVVSQYTVSAETDGMTVMENVVIDCVAMSK